MLSRRSWTFCRKWREQNCLMPFVIEPWWKILTLAKTGKKVYIWIHYTWWTKKGFVRYVEGLSSVRNSREEILLKISVFTIGRGLQFFNWHNFLMFSDRHQLSQSSFHWFDPINLHVSRAAENFCLSASTTFTPGLSIWFREGRSLTFQLDPCADTLMLIEQ